MEEGGSNMHGIEVEQTQVGNNMHGIGVEQTHLDSEASLRFCVVRHRRGLYRTIPYLCVCLIPMSVASLKMFRPSTFVQKTRRIKRRPFGFNSAGLQNRSFAHLPPSLGDSRVARLESVDDCVQRDDKIRRCDPVAAHVAGPLPLRGVG